MSTPNQQSKETYVSIAFATGDPVAVAVTLFPDEHARFTLSTSGDRPVLTIKHGPTLIRILPDLTEQITDVDVATARQLAAAASAYRADIERRHAEQTGQGRDGA